MATVSNSRTLAIATRVAGAISLGLAVAIMGWSIAHPGDHDLKRWFTAGLLTIISVLLFVVSRNAVTSYRVEEPEVGRPGPTEPPHSLTIADEQAERARSEIEKLSTEKVRQELNRSLSELKTDRERREFRLVVFGTGSAGKTSLINAILGRQVGATDPTMGTTRQGEFHTEVIEGIDGTLILTDTPGLSEFGSEGETREREAKRLAESADLILFVLDHDLIRAEAEALLGLAAIGKRLIVVLNKVDRFPDEDRDAILDKLRERLKGRVAPEDIVTVAAAPRPVPVKVVKPDGSVELHYETEPSVISELEASVARILDREGGMLRAGNLLLRARRLERLAVEALAKERHARALAVVEKYQWIAAASVFASPTAALNLAAGGASQYQMVIELTRAYGVELSQSRSRALVAQMMAALLKLGLAEAATTLVAGLFKSSLFGFAAAGAVQAVTIAYLTRVSGLAFAEYFTRDQSWGEGGINATLLRQFDATSRTDFLQEFIKQAASKLADRAGLRPSSEASVSDK